MLSERYVRDRFLPDKAIDLVDRAASRLRLRSPAPVAGPAERFEQLSRARDVAVDAEDYERAEALTRELEAVAAELATAGQAADDPELTADDVAAAVGRATGIPVARVAAVGAADRARLLALEALLERRVVGQDTAVEAVADAVRSGRAGLASAGRPVGSLRISAADPRERHRGISQHTRSVLELCLGGVTVAWPRGVDAPEWLAPRRDVDVTGWEEACADLPLDHMGRGAADDPAFFAAAFAAGVLARTWTA